LCNPVTVEFPGPVREQMPVWLEELRAEVSHRDALPLVATGVQLQRFLCRTKNAAAEVHVVRVRGPWPGERSFAHICIRLRRFSVASSPRSSNAVFDLTPECTFPDPHIVAVEFLLASRAMVRTSWGRMPCARRVA